MSATFPKSFGDPLSVFTHRGYECRVYAGPIGNPNGYALIPEAKFGSYEAINEAFWTHSLVGCNGEWTYCEKIDGVTVIGFDTSHSHDGPETQNVAWVSEEIRRGVDNLIHLAFAPLLEGSEQTHHTGSQEPTLGFMIRAIFGPSDVEEVTS